MNWIIENFLQFILPRDFSLTAEFHHLKFFGIFSIHQRFKKRNNRRNETFFCIYWWDSTFDLALTLIWTRILLGIAASMDCFTDNGGCSHFCHSDGCACPPCWVLDTDDATCIPDPNHVTTTCGPSGMSIDVDECVYNGDTMTLTLNDGACEGQDSTNSPRYISWWPTGRLRNEPPWGGMD